MRLRVGATWAGVLTLVLNAACGDGSPPEPLADDTPVSGTRKAIIDLQEKVDELAGSSMGDPVQWASDDIENIGDWEYKVVDFSTVPGSDWEQSLNDYGNDRWQLAWIDRPAPETVVIVMKRPAISLLSKIPLSQLGPLMMRDSGTEE